MALLIFCGQMNKKIIDRNIGNLLIPPLSLFRRKSHPPSNIHKILIIRMFGVGDAVLVSSIISKLKSDNDIQVSVLATGETKGIFQLSEADKIFSFNISNPNCFLKVMEDLRKERFDAIIDTEQFANLSSLVQFILKSSYGMGFDQPTRRKMYDKTIQFNPNIHTLHAFQHLFSELGFHIKLNHLLPLKVSSQDRKLVSSYLLKLPKKKLLIGIHPGTGDTAIQRRWMPERFAKVADHLISNYNANLVLTGTNAERQLLEHIAKSMKHKPIILTTFTLPQFVALTEKFDLFISNDTGPMHISAAMGTPTLGLFGPNTPARWAPLNKNSHFIYRKLPCSPCIQSHLGIVPNKCPLYPSAKCMEEISVDEVKKQAGKMLKDTAKTKPARFKKQNI